MKYPERKMSIETSMPISVQSWFGHELEIRGIDAVIYSRYIISLLLQDKVELDPGEVDADPLWGHRADVRKLQRGKKNEKKKFPCISEEEKKKCAAVECLIGISEEATDIEELVEELFHRLKDINSQKENREPRVDLSNQGAVSERTISSSSSEDPAERYYAAFPALQGQTGIKLVWPSLQSSTSVWRKNPITSQNAGSSQDAPNDAIDNCGNGESMEESPRSPKALSKKAATRKSNDSSLDQAKKKVSDAKNSKHGTSKTVRVKKEKSSKRAARLLSWPPDNLSKGDGAKCKVVPDKSPYKKSKSMSPVQKSQDFRRAVCHEFLHRPTLPASFRQRGRTSEEVVMPPVSPEFQEQNSWYTEPLEEILESTPCSKGRLFNRLNLSLSIDQYSTGCGSSIDSTPEDSPNITKELESRGQPAFAVDIWQILSNQHQNNQSYEELILPAFFTGNEQENSSTFRELGGQEQEPWMNSELDSLTDVYQLQELADKENRTENSNNEDSTSTTSGACLQDLLSSQQVSDLSSFDYRDLGKEIHINPFNFSESLEDKPCSQSSPSQYKAWGSLPFDELTEDLSIPDLISLKGLTDTVDEGQTCHPFLVDSRSKATKPNDITETKITESLLEDLNRFQQDDLFALHVDRALAVSEEVATPASGNDLPLYPKDSGNNTHDQTHHMHPVIRERICEEICKEHPTDFVKVLWGNEDLESFSVPPMSESEWNQVKGLYYISDPNTPVMDGQSTDNPMDICEESCQLLQTPIASPDPLSEVSVTDDFDCFLSESSISMFGDLINKAQPSYEQSHKSAFLSFETSRKQGLFSTALFTDIMSPLFQENIYVFPSYSSHESILKKLWAGSKPSPVGSGSNWYDALGDDSATDENCFQKVYSSQLSASHSNWIGQDTSDMATPYIPSFSLWLEKNNPLLLLRDDESFCEDKKSDDCVIEDPQVDGFQGLWKHQKSLSLENLSTSLWESCNLEDCTPLSKSFDLVPSEHSAFDDVVPKKLSHVLSEPIIKYSQTSPDSLGLYEETDGRESETDPEAKSHLFFSPKTHFRPIQTPEDQSHAVTPFDSSSDLNLSDLFGGHSPTLKTPYQSYLADENVLASFIPRFKVNKATTKCVQTGYGLDSADSAQEEDLIEGNVEIDETTDDGENNIVFDVLGEIGDSPVCLLESDWEDQATINYSQIDEPSQKDGAQEEWNLRSLWMVDSDLEQDSLSRVSTPCKGYGNIWSTGGDTDIPPLPHIPSFEAEQQLLWPVVDEDGDSVKDEASFPITDDKNVNEENNVESCLSKLEGSEWATFVPFPEKAVYSSELEQKWLSSDNKSETPSSEFKGKRKHSRKPCSFFLEGHCRRSDCRFAHDMSSITCRFWEEGDCFKGSTCPFLHGYPSFSDDTDSEPSTCSRKASGEWKAEDFPSLSDVESPVEKTVKKKSLSKAAKKAAFVKKAWSTYRTYRRSTKVTDKTDQDSIPRKT